MAEVVSLYFLCSSAGKVTVPMHHMDVISSVLDYV